MNVITLVETTAGPNTSEVSSYTRPSFLHVFVYVKQINGLTNISATQSVSYSCSTLIDVVYGALGNEGHIIRYVTFPTERVLSVSIFSTQTVASPATSADRSEVSALCLTDANTQVTVADQVC